MALPPKFAGQMVATAGAEVKHTVEICTSPNFVAHFNNHFTSPSAYHS